MAEAPGPGHGLGDESADEPPAPEAAPQPSGLAGFGMTGKAPGASLLLPTMLTGDCRPRGRVPPLAGPICPPRRSVPLVTQLLGLSPGDRAPPTQPGPGERPRHSLEHGSPEPLASPSLGPLTVPWHLGREAGVEETGGALRPPPGLSGPWRPHPPSGGCVLGQQVPGTASRLRSGRALAGEDMAAGPTGLPFPGPGPWRGRPGPEPHKSGSL